MQQPTTPIMVHVVEEPVRSTTVADVIVGAIGLTGALVLIALVSGGILGGVLIALKRLRARNRDPREDSDAIHISPYA